MSQSVSVESRGFDLRRKTCARKRAATVPESDLGSRETCILFYLDYIYLDTSMYSTRMIFYMYSNSRELPVLPLSLGGRQRRGTPGMAGALERWAFAIACVDAVEVALKPDGKRSRSNKRTVVYYVIRIQYRGDDDQVRAP